MRLSLQMIYDYRWLGSVGLNVFIIILIFFFDFLPEWHALSSLQTEEKQLQKVWQLMEKKSVQKKMADFSLQNPEPYKVIASINGLANEQGLLVQDMNMIKSNKKLKTEQILIFHFIVQGSYQQFYLFSQALSKQSIPMLLGNYKAKPLAEGLIEMSMDVIAFAALHRTASVSSGNALMIRHSPFCRKEVSSISRIDTTALSKTALGQVRLVGYFAQHPRQQALIQLPNHAVLAITRGDVIGKEQMRVKEIKPRSLSLISAEGKEIELSMQ